MMDDPHFAEDFYVSDLKEILDDPKDDWIKEMIEDIPDFYWVKLMWDGSYIEMLKMLQRRYGGCDDRKL